MANERRIVELVLKAVGDKELKQITRDLVAMRQATEASQRSLSGMGSALGSVANFAKGFAGAFGTAQIISWTKAILDSADALDAAAEQAGIDVERYQVMKEAFRSLEVDARQFETGMERLAATLSETLAGDTTAATKALDRLGIRSKILSGEIATTDELVEALSKSQKALGDDASFTAEMVEILGRKLGVDYANALKDGKLATAEAAAEMAKFGVVSKEQIAILADASETVDQFTTRSGNAILIWSANVIKAFEGVGAGIADLQRRMAQGASFFQALAQYRQQVEETGRLDAEQARIDKMLAQLGAGKASLASLVTRPAPVVPRQAGRTGASSDSEAAGARAARDAEKAATEAARQHAKALSDLREQLADVNEERERAIQDTRDQALVLERAANPQLAYLEGLEELDRLNKEVGLSTGAYELALKSLNDERQRANQELVENSQAEQDRRKAEEQRAKDLEKAREQWGYVADAMGQATYDIITGTEKIGQAVKRMVASIIAEFIRLQLIKLATKFLSGPFPGISFSAGGNAFGGSGIISTPTAHGIRGGGIGIAGEAGPEAILPLQRNASGQLGVVAATGAPVVNVNNYAGNQVNVRQSERGLEIDIMERQLADRVRRGGSTLPRALENTYRTGRGASAYS